MEISLALLPMVVVAVIALALGVFTVEQQTAAVVERFGRFLRIADAGLHVRIPLVDTIRERVSLRVQQLNVTVESKSRDNVFVNVAIAVQYQVTENNVREAVYQLTDHKQQVEAYVFDVVRAEVPNMTLEEVFENKSSIATAVDTELTERMERYGYQIVNVLVNDIDPDERVKTAMNEVQAASREREAATQRAEGIRITLVKQAEAEAESKRLQGEGLANQRKAIAAGLRESVELLRATTGQPLDDRAVMEQLLLVQWMDTQKEIAANNRATVIFLPNNPGAMGDIADQIRTSMLSADAADIAGRGSN
jgi:regulator of protease activity HflC (stomatin/prohibitin superfamily)